MSKILIIGAGAMGSAFTFPCIDNKHDVTLIGSPLENDQIDNLNKDSFHKNLKSNFKMFLYLLWQKLASFKIPRIGK